ncbi:PA14 domain-containing protein [Tellurirhabdus rosea]|uniref:PA14 domain-containing protein n=1 Tax=Tellurirhabdus rosea TaxID=2674997 RepID=UPI0022526DB1|nr:PA14 domain-containing protein [Tellurirhabdus rosea]
MKNARNRILLGLWICLSLQARSQPGGAAPSAGDGLLGEYFTDWSFRQKVVARRDRQIDFSYDGYSAPVKGLHPQRFSVRWTGQLYAPVSGSYKFTAVVDDGIRIWVNGVLAMDEWRYRRQKLTGQSIPLKTGQFYDFKVEYYNARAGGYVQVNWNLVSGSAGGSTLTDSPQEKINGSYFYSQRPKPAVAVPPPKPKPVPPVVAKKAPKPTATRSLPPGKPAAPDSSKAVLTLKPPVGQINPAIIQFRQSDFTLLPQAYPELDKLAAALRSQPSVTLQVIGHTDNVGEPRLNQLLSEYRAKVVVSYLIQKGIEPHRLSAAGCGGTKPLTGNATEADRAQNRRVEFVLRSPQ